MTQKHSKNKGKEKMTKVHEQFLKNVIDRVKEDDDAACPSGASLSHSLSLTLTLQMTLCQYFGIGTISVRCG